jgi:His/Glu/Gln/Arg/opine family amino acid ABC transporter permease subunit
MELDFAVVWDHWPQLLQGVKVTTLAFLIALSVGAPLAALVCAGTLRETGVLAGIARGYVTVFRTIPEIVLIFWMFYCLPPLVGVRPTPTIGVLFGSLALALVSAAYLAEIYRGGIQSVDRGQWEATKALALPRRTVWLRVIIPQATRISVPPFINFLTELLKGTTLLATVGVADLALQAYVLGAQTFRYLEFLTAIAVVYFIIIFPIARFSEWVEHRLSATTR